MILAGRHVSQQQLYRPDFHPSHVDELSSAHPCMADTPGKNRRHQLGTVLSRHLPTLNIINTPGAIILGMVYNFLPFMVLAYL